MSIHKNRRQRRSSILDAQAPGAIDALARKRRQYTVAAAIHAGRATERPGQSRPTFEPRDCHGGIGGASAIDREEAARLHFAVRRREVVDLEDFVEHDDPGAQDRCAAAGYRNATSSSTQARMM